MNTRLAIAATVTIGALLVGCTPEADPTPSPTPTTTSADPTPSPSPTTQSPTPESSPTPTDPMQVDWFPDEAGEDESDVQAEIRAGWENYERVMDKFVRDPEMNDLTEIQHVTTGQEATDAVQGVVLTRQNNHKREGYVTFRDAVISEPVTNADGVTTAEVNYCFDPEHLRTVDVTTGEPGENAIKPEQTMKVMVLMELMPDGTWRAAQSQTELAPC